MQGKLDKSCAVPSCVTSSSVLKQFGVTLRYFSFPKDTKLREKWLSSCNKTSFSYKKCDRICSRHFKTSDYKLGCPSKFANTDLQPKILKSTAIPSLFLKKSPEQPSSMDIFEYHRILAHKILHGHNETKKSGENPHFVDFPQSESKFSMNQWSKSSVETDEIQQSHDQMDFDPLGGEDMTMIDIKEESDTAEYCTTKNEQVAAVTNNEYFEGNCYICDKSIRQRNLGQLSREDFMKIIQKVFKDIATDFVIVLSDSDDLCAACCGLVARVAKLEAELRTVSLGLRALLRLKYALLQPALETSEHSKNQDSLTQTTTSLSAHKKNKRTQTEFLLREKNTQTVRPYPEAKPTLNIGNCVDEVELVEVGLQKENCDSNSESVLQTLATKENVDYPENISDPTELVMNDNHLAKESEVEIETKRQTGAIERAKSTVEGISKKEVGVLKCTRYRCAFTTKSPEQMKTHMSSFINKEGFYCSICDFAHHHQELYAKHKTCHSEVSKNKQCILCGEVVHDELHMRFHLEAKHKPNPFNYKCSMCDKVFTFASILRKHLRKSHKVDTALKCDKCEKMFTDIIKYNKHVEYYHRETLNCKYCGRQYLSVEKLITHTKSSHRFERNQHLQCRYCPKRFVMPVVLKRHEEQHTGQYQYRCGDCGLGFHEDESRRKHTRTCKIVMRKLKNTEPTRFSGHHSKVCDVCGKFVKTKYKLHRRMHDNPAGFQCHVCGKKFRWKYNLSIHIRNLHREQTERDMAEVRDPDSEQMKEGATEVTDLS